MPQVSVRDKIVESGFRVMYAKGFNGCSVQDITDHAGVPKGSFYNHFRSKELLALEVLDVYLRFARLDLLKDRSKRPLQRLRAHFEFLAKAFKVNGCAFGCLAGNLGSELSPTSPIMRSALVLRFGDWHDAVADIFREAQAVGEMDPGQDANRLARFAVASWEGAVLAMKIAQSTQPLDDFLETFFPLLGTPAKSAGRHSTALSRLG